MKTLLIENADLGGQRGAVRVREGRIAAAGPAVAPEAGEPCLDARGGALLPGLHDHHIHLMALAAARDSIPCGPPAVRNASQLAAVLRAAAAEASSRGGERAWVRGIGYHESVAGTLDRRVLDALVDASPVRIQHRSGARWIVNSRGLEALGIGSAETAPRGVLRDRAGQPTGQLQRVDAWLRTRLGAKIAPGLAGVGHDLARLGVTGICDASPGNGRAELAVFSAAAAAGDLPQRIRVMGSLALPTPEHPRLDRGPLKIMLDEDDLPRESELVDTIGQAHAQGRGVAFHCVTRAELVVAAGALERAGSNGQDRIEHASLAPPDAVAWLARLGVTVVTQPNFLCERGDSYREDVAERDQPWLYRGRGFVEAGVPLGGGTDAPFGDCDPWAAMRAAVRRRSAGGARMQPSEALDPERALGLFTSPLEAPGRPRPALAPGQAADLVLLDRPWQEARQRLTADDVVATLVAGDVVWHRDASIRDAVAR